MEFRRASHSTVGDWRAGVVLSNMPERAFPGFVDLRRNALELKAATHYSVFFLLGGFGPNFATWSHHAHEAFSLGRENVGVGTESDSGRSGAGFRNF